MPCGSGVAGGTAGDRNAARRERFATAASVAVGWGAGGSDPSALGVGGVVGTTAGMVWGTPSMLTAHETSSPGSTLSVAHLAVILPRINVLTGYRVVVVVCPAANGTFTVLAISG